ncbi:L-threonylcarbamoyladenylate synthase [Qipengyuania sp. JC766]|uniref:L-threonylcarbamoyladenylate synthase n=1 Tax=Qipengyuania sp. JC766 TaxID=3232139 RepID=UPI003457B9BD
MSSKNATETVAADAGGIARAVAILERGGLVAVPTETVFGLAARADSDEAVTAIYRAKGRPDFNPLIVHVANGEAARELADFPPGAAELMDRYWPAPLTLVLPARSDVRLAPAVTAGLPTVALRSPAHPVMQALLAQCDFPLAAPSANRSGFVSPTSPAHVLRTLDGRIDLVLDGGADCENGLESTILAIRGDGSWEELRPGPVDLEALHRDFGRGPLLSSSPEGALEAPGQMTSHYAPGKPVRLDALRAEDDEFFIGFGAIAGDVSLSAEGDLATAAASLYACLHRAASSAKPKIAVASVPNEGIGIAINDRLRRAAA